MKIEMAVGWRLALMLIGVLVLLFVIYPAIWWLVCSVGLNLPISFARVWVMWFGTVVVACTGWAITYLLSDEDKEKPRLTKGR